MGRRKVSEVEEEINKIDQKMEGTFSKVEDWVQEIKERLKIKSTK